MKNLKLIKAVLFQAMIMGSMVLFLVACEERKTTDSMEIAEEENIAKMTASDDLAVVIENDEDAEFMMEAAEIQLEQIMLGKLAQQKGSTQHVKDLGRMMEEDYTKSFEEIKALADSKSISIPTNMTEDSREDFVDIEDEEGNDFGKAYSQRVVEQHEDAIDLFEKAASDSEDADIRSWASEKLPTLKAHLQHAKECKEACDKIDS